MKIVLGLLIILGAASFTSKVIAESSSEVINQLSTQLTTYSGSPIDIIPNKFTHFVFIDIWSIYQNSGDEKFIEKLPTEFLKNSQQIWLQPQMNVTKAQLLDFQKSYQQIKPLILDDNFSLMKRFKVWESPHHVLIKDGKQVFSGNEKALIKYAFKSFNIDMPIEKIANTNSENKSSTVKPIVKSIAKPIVKSIKLTEKKTIFSKPIVGDKAPLFSSKTLTNNPFSLQSSLQTTRNKKISLVFLDSLCPMPHLPNCQQELKKLNHLVKSDKTRQWLGVISSFYSNEEFAQQFSDNFELDLPLIFDHGNNIFKRYYVHATPYQIEINQKGIIESRSEQLH